MQNLNEGDEKSVKFTYICDVEVFFSALLR